jgi:O-antigen/teichoic acid export membrane protein
MTSVRRSMQWNVGASWFVHAASLVIGFFLMPFVIHKLGDGQYGVWVFINCLAGYAGLLYLGFGQTISRYVAKYSAAGEWQKLNEVSSLVFFVYVGGGLIALTAAGVIAALVPYFSIWKTHSVLEIRLVILMLGLNVATGLIGSVFGGVLMGLRRFDLERGVSFTVDVTRLVLIVLFLQREWGLLAIATIYWVVTLTENLGYVLLAYRQLPQLSIRPSHLNWSVFRECSSFSGFAFLSAIAHQLIYATDTVVIGVLLGETAITPYFIALRLCQYLRQPIEKISDICMPTAGALQSQMQTGNLRDLLCKALGVTFLLSAGILIGASYFGSALIQTWMGPGYDLTPALLTILLIGQVVALPVGVLRAIMFGLGHVRLPALVYLAEAAVNLVLSIVLAYYMGVRGVAWGTSIPIIVFELGIILPVGMSYLGIPLIRLLREAIVPYLLPLLALWVYSKELAASYPDHNSWPALIAITCGGGAVLGIVLGAQMLLERLTSVRSVSVT